MVQVDEAHLFGWQDPQQPVGYTVRQQHVAVPVLRLSQGGPLPSTPTIIPTASSGGGHALNYL